MTYDRVLQMSTAGSRDAVLWPQTQTTWGELVARLKTPQVGTETHVAYLRMSKAQQDKLKDVGGFVGGTLQGGRRKIKAVTGRDLITLDLDAIAAGGTLPDGGGMRQRNRHAADGSGLRRHGRKGPRYTTLSCAPPFLHWLRRAENIGLRRKKKAEGLQEAARAWMSGGKETRQKGRAPPPAPEGTALRKV